MVTFSVAVLLNRKKTTKSIDKHLLVVYKKHFHYGLCHSAPEKLGCFTSLKGKNILPVKHIIGRGRSPVRNPTYQLCCVVLQILFSADDEMDESDEDDVRRLTGLKTVKKKKLRMGIPV